MAAGRAPGAHPARALGRAGPCTAPLPPRQVPHTFLLQLSPAPPAPHPGCRRLFSCHAPAAAGAPGSSWHAPGMSFPSEHSRPGACEVFFRPSKFAGFTTSSSRKTHRSGRAIIYPGDLIRVCGMRSPTFGECAPARSERVCPELGSSPSGSWARSRAPSQLPGNGQLTVAQFPEAKPGTWVRMRRRRARAAPSTKILTLPRIWGWLIHGIYPNMGITSQQSHPGYPWEL